MGLCGDYARSLSFHLGKYYVLRDLKSHKLKHSRGNLKNSSLYSSLLLGITSQQDRTLDFDNEKLPNS